jgi:ParB family chromosome partitioning protein
VPATTALDAPESPSPSSETLANRRIEFWPIDELKDHPWQAELFHDLEGGEWEDFLASVRQEGLREPIWVTTDGVIIDGHQRVRAAEELGWTEIKAWVRDDLTDWDAIQRAHISANKDRRQLDPLDKARLAKRQMEIERLEGRRGLYDGDREDLRDRVGKQLGMSGRHAERLIKITSTPMAVQRAFSQGLITVVTAARVAGLGWVKQDQLASEIEAGADPAEVVAKYLPSKRQTVSLGKTFEKLIGQIEEALEVLEGRESESQCVPPSPERFLDAVERLVRFRDRLAPVLAQEAEASERARRELAEKLGIDFGQLLECEHEEA